MAAKGKKTTAGKTKNSRTHKPKRETWQDDLGIGYATYDHEEDYVSPTSIEELGEKELNNLRSFNQRLAMAPVFVDDAA